MATPQTQKQNPFGFGIRDFAAKSLLKSSAKSDFKKESRARLKLQKAAQKRAASDAAYQALTGKSRRAATPTATNPTKPVKRNPAKITSAHINAAEIKQIKLSSPTNILNKAYKEYVAFVAHNHTKAALQAVTSYGKALGLSLSQINADITAHHSKTQFTNPAKTRKNAESYSPATPISVTKHYRSGGENYLTNRQKAIAAGQMPLFAGGDDADRAFVNSRRKNPETVSNAVLAQVKKAIADGHTLAQIRKGLRSSGFSVESVRAVVGRAIGSNKSTGAKKNPGKPKRRNNESDFEIYITPDGERIKAYDDEPMPSMINPLRDVYTYAPPRRTPSKNRIKRNAGGWFDGYQTLDELKTHYKNLARQHHPDLGGSTRTMQEINAEYDAAMRRAIPDSNLSDKQKEDEFQAIEELREALNFAVTLPENVTIIIRGSWLWLEGQTYGAKEQIKSFVSTSGEKFKFASQKKCWFFAGVPSNGRGKMSLDEISQRHGHKVVSHKPQNKLNPAHPVGAYNAALVAFADETSGDYKTIQRLKKRTFDTGYKIGKTQTQIQSDINRQQHVAYNRMTSNRKNPAKQTRRNYSTGDAYESFNGREPSEFLTVDAPTGTPAHTYSLGLLQWLEIIDYADNKLLIKFDNPELETPHLAADTNQNLHIVGGGYKIEPRGETIGHINRICYEARKNHIGDGKTFDYVHTFSEETHEEQPTLRIDSNFGLHIDGGHYEITPLGIKN